ncbi:hypothetical protein HB968_14345 [Listeria welshimeri]|nr:hypothetical protein [Listeria welshimeri]
MFNRTNKRKKETLKERVKIFASKYAYKSDKHEYSSALDKINEASQKKKEKKDSSL